MNGLIPILQKIVRTERPLKEFALPILCDMAHSGKIGRKYLWKNDGLNFFVSLLSDPYWQVAALDAIFVWYVPTTCLKLCCACIDISLGSKTRLRVLKRNC